MREVRLQLACSNELGAKVVELERMESEAEGWREMRLTPFSTPSLEPVQDRRRFLSWVAFVLFQRCYS